MATYTSNYAWTKPSGGDPVDIEVLNDNLDDQDSIVHQAFLDLAPVFSTANTYAVKDVVLYDNKVWICHTAVTTAGAWTGSANWTQTTVGETGGVATYADLPDKPSINGNELSGNKTGAQLGLQNTLTFDNVPTANSTNPVKSGGVYSADEAIRKWTTAETKSVSGNPITLLDGSARNAEGLSVECNPKQNLHGYDHPWAGGTGKNKLPMTVANLKSWNTVGSWQGNIYTYNLATFTVDTDDDGNVIGISKSGTINQTSAFLMYATLSAGTYKVNGCPNRSASDNFSIIVKKNNTSGELLAELTSDADASFTLTESTTICIYIRIVEYNASNATFYPMIRLASVSDATFEPYSNECPITGYTECVVDRDSKNLLPITVDGIKALNTDGTWNGNEYSINNGKFTILTDSDGNVTGIKKTGTLSNSVGLRVGTISNFDGNVAINGCPSGGASSSKYKMILLYEPNTAVLIGTDTGHGFTTELSSDHSYSLYVSCYPDYTGDVIFHPMMRFASVSDATFVPYSHDNATIAFGQTVYGVRVDAKTGKTMVTHAIVDLSTFTWTDYQTNCKTSNDIQSVVAKPSSGSVLADIIAEKYQNNIPSAVVADQTTKAQICININGTIIVSDGGTGASPSGNICYELATPTELTLTPAELELLKGYNYITTNGTTIALAYLPDSLLAEAENYVDAKIPPAPSSDGTYVLTCTVTSGTPAYSWEESAT